MLEAGTAKANAALVRESVAAVTVGDTDKPLAIVAPDILIHYAERPEPKADVGSASRTSRPARPRHGCRPRHLIPSTAVYPEGFEFEVEIRHRLDEDEIEHPFFMHHPRRRRQQQAGELDPDLVRFGIEFSDGRKATNLGGHMPFAMPDEPDAPPPEPVLAPSRGGGGGGGRWHHGFWVWPLPPDGPLVFVCEWPVAGIGETRTEIDSALIRDAAAEVVELWPEESGSGPVGHGRSQTALMRAGSAAQVALPELTVETERRTQLVDITDQVRELVQRRQGAGAAVVVFVPHTTAGLLLQASGPGAATVARDMETLLERLVDESWEWQHTEEGDRNPWAHARAALTAPSVTVPLKNGEPALGELQRIFLCEFDGPRRRRVRLSVI